MAKLKAAFEAEYYKSYRRPLRDYVFGYFHLVAMMLAPVAPVVNFFMQIPQMRSLAARVLEVTPNRPFPKFTRERATPNRITDVVLNRDFLPTDSLESPGSSKDRRVIYLSDPYARHIEPEVEQAAFDILNVLGFEIILLPVVSAGAAFISKGFLEQARRHAQRVLKALNKIDPSGVLPVVGIEPPEIYTLKHDYIDLLPEQREEIERRAGKIWLFEEFVIRTQVFDALRIANLTRPADNITQTKLKFHPHCHQRAEGPSKDGLPNGVNATIEMLRVCGYDVELIDSGCCGMAGTFGYEAEHYELSMKVGELKLLPYIRQLQITNSRSLISNPQSETVNRQSQIVSTGAACRMQIQQGTGVQAEHPILVAARVLCP
jgi:Fe-S oxidoreductase